MSMVPSCPNDRRALPSRPRTAPPTARLDLWYSKLRAFVSHAHRVTSPRTPGAHHRHRAAHRARLVGERREHGSNWSRASSAPSPHSAARGPQLLAPSYRKRRGSCLTRLLQDAREPLRESTDGPRRNAQHEPPTVCRSLACSHERSSPRWSSSASRRWTREGPCCSVSLGSRRIFLRAALAGLKPICTAPSRLRNLSHLARLSGRLRPLRRRRCRRKVLVGRPRDRRSCSPGSKTGARRAHRWALDPGRPSATSDAAFAQRSAYYDIFCLRELVQPSAFPARLRRRLRRDPSSVARRLGLSRKTIRAQPRHAAIARPSAADDSDRRGGCVSDHLRNRCFCGSFPASSAASGSPPSESSSSPRSAADRRNHLNLKKRMLSAYLRCYDATQLPIAPDTPVRICA